MKNIMYSAAVFILCLFQVGVASAVTVLDRTYTAQDLNTEGNIFNRTTTFINGGNTLRFNGNAVNPRNQVIFQMDLLASGVLDGAQTTTIDFNFNVGVGPGDNDFLFGISDGSNAFFAQRADNSGWRIGLFEGSVAGDFSVSSLTSLGQITGAGFSNNILGTFAFSDSSGSVTSSLNSTSLSSGVSQFLDASNGLTFLAYENDNGEVYDFNSLQISIDGTLATVPEPNILALLSFGLVGVGLFRHKRG